MIITYITYACDDEMTMCLLGTYIHMQCMQVVPYTHTCVLQVVLYIPYTHMQCMRVVPYTHTCVLQVVPYTPYTHMHHVGDMYPTHTSTLHTHTCVLQYMCMHGTTLYTHASCCGYMYTMYYIMRCYRSRMCASNCTRVLTFCLLLLSTLVYID
jgi:hypothetical protein